MLKKLLCLLFTVIIGLGFFNAVRSEPLKRIVKIPDYEMEGFIYTDDIGLRTGYSYEVFQEIAKYTNWEFEYVKCDRSQCIDMLKNGELDIVDSCIYMDERTTFLDYSDINGGYGSKALVTKEDNTKFYPNDFENYNGMRIGIVDEKFWEDSINKLSKQKGFSPQIIKFKTYAEKFDAFNNGKIDAIVTMSIQTTKKHNVLFEFDSEPYYFVTDKSNSEIMDELNSAMHKVVENDNTYFLKIYNKYYEKKANTKFSLTEEEKEYIKSHNIIKAVDSNNRAPLSSFNDETGSYEGIVADIMKKAADKAGFKIEFEKTETYKDAIQKVRQGDCDIICDFFCDYSWAEKNDIKMSVPYIRCLKYNAIINKDKVDEKPETLKIAYVDNYFFNKKFLFEKYSAKHMILYNSEKECIEAVNNGDADITFIINYVGDKIISENNYYDISVMDYPEFQHSVCFGVSREGDMPLFTIMNKAIASISQEEVNDIISKHTIFNKNNIGMIDFLQRYFWLIVIVILIIAVVGIKIIIRVLKLKRKYDENIFDLAYIDKVTGIWNLNGFISEVTKKTESNDFKQRSFAIISFDISKFRVVNEHYGRFVGDRVLKFISNNLNNEIQYGGVIARINMDNFIVMVPFSEKNEHLEFLKKVMGKTRYYEDGGIALKLNFQCGIYLITSNEVSVVNAIDMAEMARKEAKNNRNDNVVFFDKKMENKIIQYKEIEENMERALEEHEFAVYYQPKVDMKSEKIIGAEALVRWISKTKGFMNPGEFIPVFEKEGFIIELDFFVLEEVFKIIREWIDSDKEPITISVNQSRVHLSNPFYIERIENLIKKYNIPTKYIELELTENLFMEMDAALEIVNKIKELGFSVSIDDFGSGFSSLNMLKSMPIDVVKIDREFLNESENSEKAQKIICKIVEMAKALDMNVICEGVEKNEQAVFLKSIGCYYAQGFLYAKPMPEPEFRDRIKNAIERRN